MCANIDFPFPGTLSRGALARAAGHRPGLGPLVARNERCGRCSRWSRRISTSRGWRRWPSTSATPRRCRGPKRFSSIRHVADLFDRYAVHRPDMLQRWAAGSPQTRTRPPGRSELWRLLRDRIGQPSPAERLVERLPAPAGRARAARPPAAAVAVRPHPAARQLPRRPRGHGRRPRRPPLLAASLAGAVGPPASPRSGPRRATCPGPRTRPPALPSNPLLRSWGRDAREMQLVLGAAAPHGEGATDAVHAEAPTLLQRIQDDVRADRAAGRERR